MSVELFRTEVADKNRFEFGENWKEFLSRLSDERIQIAENCLKELLKVESLEGKTFLDIGSGSGLSSLVARNMGASVDSFDFDEASVWCTSELKARYYPGDDGWSVSQGSVLDADFLASLGKCDVVYSWGVLHHTGEMWRAIDNSLKLVDDGGAYFIAIYNDQGFKSHVWWLIKYIYNHLPTLLRKPFAYFFAIITKFLVVIKYTLKLRPMDAIRPLLNYKDARGMSILSDTVDWFGGFPFEFAKYEHLVRYIEAKGYTLKNSVRANSLDCHELVFVKNS